MRHAKSDWKNSVLKDFDRPLNERGKDSIEIMSKALKKQNICPDIILSSPALRAKITAKGIGQGINYNKAIVYEKDFYFSNLSSVIDIIKKTNNKNNNLMIFGHDPMWSELVYRFSGKNIDMPTCSICGISFEIDSWNDIVKQQGNVVVYEYPKKEPYGGDTLAKG
jgi:phosphohistidine phosphatase